jgi:signal transduction histidine kinase
MTHKITSLEQIEAQTFRRQQTAFCVLTLFVLAVLLLIHTLFASLLGEPSEAVLLLLGFSFSAKVGESIWLQSKRDGIPENVARLESAISIVGIFILAGLLALLTDRDDAPYFVLLSVPILQCAYHFGLLPTIFTISAAIGMIFAWMQHFYAVHPPARPTEFLEYGMISVIFCLMGMLVWYLVNQLKEKQVRLFRKMAELDAAKERLRAEEKLAAIGRLASGIAHEVRNPVAMISSSLATAAYPGSDPEEREEMFAIAAREAKRLETLTTDFLTYARPSQPRRSSVAVSDMLNHIAEVTKMRSAERSIDVTCTMEQEAFVDVDAAQVEGALLNLCLNAIDATPDHGRIALKAEAKGHMLRVDIEDSGKRISERDLARVFEPFFTTKPAGTGLGLAIAKGVAVAHGGDSWVSNNQDGLVVFTLTLESGSTKPAQEEPSDG